jgi:hypothetical protein
MKKFLVLYHTPVSAREQMANATPEQAKAGMDAWMAWSSRSGSAIVDLGAPVAAAANIGGSSGAGDVGGYSIVQAASVEAAKKLFDGHPHLMFPGASIEVLEFLPMPGM